MTDRTQPEALRLAEEISNLVCSSEAAAKTIAAAADELCRLHVENASLRASLAASPTPPAEQQAAPKAAPAGWKLVPVNPTPEMWKAAKSVPDPNPPYPPHYGLVWDAMLAASPTPPAEQQAAPKAAPGDAIDEAMRERDDAEDFIDALLDEVLGHERPEWSNLYGRADALNDVQERMTSPHKPAVDNAWGQFQSAMAAPQQVAQEPVATLHCNDIGYVWARATEVGKRMRFEQPINLYTAPQPAPAPLSDDAKDAARYRWLRNKSTVLHGTAWLGSATAYQRDVDFLRRDDALAALDAAIDAALAAQGGK